MSVFNKMVNSNTHNELKERIENMSKYHQIEILKILNKFKNIKKNENKNGTFINLSELPQDVIDELEAYTCYVEKQQSHLSIIEEKKELLEKTYFNDSSITIKN